MTCDHIAFSGDSAISIMDDKKDSWVQCFKCDKKWYSETKEIEGLK